MFAVQYTHGEQSIKLCCIIGNLTLPHTCNIFVMGLCFSLLASWIQSAREACLSCYFHKMVNIMNENQRGEPIAQYFDYVTQRRSQG
jgi:hypothetical protein